MCGIIGMFCVDSVNQQIYDNLHLLQHRGQDSAGIVTMDNHTFHGHKQKGRVREAFRTRDMRKLLGNAGIGHVRYATRGAAASEEEVQPFYVNAPYGITFVHNGNLTNTLQLSRICSRLIVVTPIPPAIRRCWSMCWPRRFNLNSQDVI